MGVPPNWKSSINIAIPDLDTGAQSGFTSIQAPQSRIDIYPADGLETGRPGRNPLAGLISFATFGSQFRPLVAAFRSIRMSHEGP
jgi:hypothetical protein